MNSNEAKFILRARRPDGRDDAEPAVAEALEQARRDPALGAWLAREQAFDAAVGARLREVAPPAGLRDAILAGARLPAGRGAFAAADARAPWWRQARTLAVAASVAVLFAVAAAWSSRAVPPTDEQFALGAMSEWETPEHQPLFMGGRGALAALLGDARVRLGSGLPLEFAEMRTNGCRVIRIAGREVLEVCFARPGVPGELHLYIARREDFGGDRFDARPMFRERGVLASVTWADTRHVYALLSDAGADSLRAAL